MGLVLDLKAERLILIGLDDAMPEMVLKFCDEGYTPNTASLMERGVFSKALPCPPVDAPTNWVSIVTPGKVEIWLRWNT